MPALTEPAATSLEDRCRLCETVLTADARWCPKCGLPARRPEPEAVEVRTVDIVLSVVMAMIALLLTLPLTAAAVANAALSGSWSIYAGRLIILAVWNSIMIGAPIAILARRWMTHVRRGNFERAWMWRDYWRLQLAACSPVAGALLALWVFNLHLSFLWHLVW